jgi:hypothetical protein
MKTPPSGWRISTWIRNDCRVRYALTHVGGTLTLLEPTSDGSRRTIVSQTRRSGSPVPSDAQADGTPGRGISVERHWPRVHISVRHAVPPGDNHTCLPGCSGPGRAAARALPSAGMPPPRSCWRKARPSRTSGASSGTARHADLVHARVCSGATPAVAGAGDQVIGREMGGGWARTS